MQFSVFCAQESQTHIILPLEKLSNHQLLPLVRQLLDYDIQEVRLDDLRVISGFKLYDNL